MSRGVVTVRLHRFSAVVTGPSWLWDEMRRSGLRWHRHETERSTWRVHRADLDDLVTQLEVAGYEVEVPDRPAGAQGVA